MRDTRANRALHALDADGMVACNPRDPEAAHRADVEAIATTVASRVTCAKCRAWLHDQARRTRRG